MKTISNCTKRKKISFVFEMNESIKDTFIVNPFTHMLYSLQIIEINDEVKYNLFLKLIDNI